MQSRIIRNNQNFLKEVIDPDKIIFPLESCGCLTEDQVTFLRRLRNRKDKNHELLVMLQDSSSQKYSKFVDCLFSTNQAPAALVLERGGEALKVHINYGKATRAKELEMELIRRLQRMQTENTLILNDLLNASVKERLNDVFLLHAKQNKGIELWFWCNTKRSLNEMKSLSEEDIREIIQRLIPEHSALLEPQLIQMDRCLPTDFAKRQLSIRRVRDRESLILFGFGSPTDITCLSDKIYVTQETGEILVYSNKYPYKSLKSIVLSYKESQSWIASCNVNKCLYISFLRNDHILKVGPMLDNRVSEWLFETGLSIISITSRGDVFVLRIGIDDNELRLHTHEATVKRTISMEDRYSQTQFIQEIMPDIVALNYDNLSKPALSRISIMELDENGTVLGNTELHEAIDGLYTFRYGDLFIGVFEHKSVLPQRNNDNRCVKLQHWTLESNLARDLLTIDEKITAIHAFRC